MDLYELVQAVQKRLGDRVSRRIKSVLKFCVYAILGLVVMGAVGVELTSSPKFCVSCHYMKPYYESWKTSSHSEVACIDCHFPPGIRSEMEQKFRALVQVAKYVTRQYGTRPWTEIEDASCLRSGCHKKRLLRGKVKFKGVEFDHLPHLTSFRRVTRLRCTSCHSQLVQGQHLTVTEASCYLCHFKEGPEYETMSECTTCHSFPIEAKSGSFDHDWVQERGVDCLDCHANVIQGDGQVPKDRCLLCHSEPERLQRYSDTAFMHFNHVTAHKIECTQCHNAIVHESPKPARLHPIADKADVCARCHQSQHQAIPLLYAGQGGFGVPETPDPMFKAGVTCKACHRELGEAGAHSTTRHTGAAGCMYCHGEEYGAELAQWRMEFREPVEELSLAVLEAERLVAKIPISRQEKRAAGELIQEALTNIHLVQYGNGVHNPIYARQLLRHAASQANTALALVGSAYRVPVPQAPAIAGKSECLNCHPAVPAASQPIFGVRFSHTRHVQTAGLTCERCHDDGSPEKPGHGRMHLTIADCQGCHLGKLSSPHPAAWRVSHRAQVKKSPQQCKVCHTDNQCSSCHGLSMPHPGDWSAIHATPARENMDLCSRCHKTQEQECTSCHGVQMPHPDTWLFEEHGPSYRGNLEVCQRCHESQECAQCHEVGMPHPESWLGQHGKQANESPSTCQTCHQPKDCLLCHRASVASHDQDWPKNHPTAGASQPDLCELCHKADEADSCITCHGLPLPHSESYALEHGDEASFETDTLCFKCHDLAEDCGICHADVLQ